MTYLCQQLGRSPIVFILAAGWFATPLAEAGDLPSATGSSPYRLNLPSEAYRLANYREYRLDEQYQPTPAQEPEVEAGSPPAFSDKPFAKEIESAARDALLDPALVHAVIHVESRHRQTAVSPKGAIGLMQVLPETALRYGVRNPGRSVQENLRAGTRYLRDLMSQFDNRLHLVLAAYNAGEGAVTRYSNRIPPYPETRAYVPAVMMQYVEWRAERPPELPSQVKEYHYLPGTRLVPRFSIAP
jgi:soluble lytic murein transglycosylase-like protein